jgi:hypothetical protein
MPVQLDSVCLAVLNSASPPANASNTTLPHRASRFFGLVAAPSSTLPDMRCAAPGSAAGAATANAARGQRACGSAKVGVKERLYSVEALRQGAALVLSKRRAGLKFGARAAAEALGAPTMRSSLNRLLTKAYKAATDAAGQDAFVDAYEFPIKGSETFALRRMFNEDELDAFAEVIKYSAASGFGYDVPSAQELLRDVVERDRRVRREGLQRLSFLPLLKDQGSCPARCRSIRSLASCTRSRVRSWPNGTRVGWISPTSSRPQRWTRCAPQRQTSRCAFRPLPA